MKWLFVSENVGVCLGQIRSCDVVLSFDICLGRMSHCYSQVAGNPDVS